MSWRPLAAVVLCVAGSMSACGPAEVPPAPRGEPIPLAALPTSTAKPPAPPAPPPPEPQPGSLPVTRADAIRGEALAPVTALAVADLTAPNAANLFAALSELGARYGTRKLRRAYKTFVSAGRAQSREVALASVAAGRAGGDRALWAFVDLAVAATSPPTGDMLAAWAASAGAPRDKFRKALAAPEVAAKVDEDAALAKQLGTIDPLTVYVNGVECSRRSGFRWADRAKAVERLAVVIDDELSLTRSAQVEGVPPERIYAERTRLNRQERRLPAALAEDLEGGVFAVPLGSSPVRGPPSALVTVVELSDYQCPFCKRVQSTLADLRKKYGDDVRFVFKHVPLAFHPHAEPAAELAAEAYAKRGATGFWQVHDLIWAASPNLELPRLLDIALRARLDADAVRAAIVDKRHAATIDADRDLAKLLRANSTPQFFINGRRVLGAQPLETFQRVIDEELAGARDLVRAGVPRERVYEEVMRFAMTPPAVPAPAAGSSSPASPPSLPR